MKFHLYKSWRSEAKRLNHKEESTYQHNKRRITKGAGAWLYKNTLGLTFYIWQVAKSLAIMLLALIPDMQVSESYKQIAVRGQVPRIQLYMIQGSQLRGNLVAAGAILLGICLILFRVNWKFRLRKKCNPHFVNTTHNWFKSKLSLGLGSVALLVVALFVFVGVLMTVVILVASSFH